MPQRQVPITKRAMDNEGASSPRASRARSHRAMPVALGIDALGSGLFLPLSLLFFTVVIGLPLGTVGVVLSAATAVTLVVPLFAGACADRFGARTVVVAAQLLQAGGFCGYLVVRDVPTLCGTVLLVVVGERMFWATVFTFVAETADGRELDAWYARVTVTRTIGLGAGTLGAGIVVGAGSRLLYQVAILGNAVSFVVAALLLAFVARERRPAAPRVRTAGGYRDVLRDRPFLAFTATNLVFSLCMTIVTVALPVYVVEGLAGPGWLAGGLFALNTAVLILAQTRVTKTVGGYRRTRVLAAAGGLWLVWSLAMAGGALGSPGGLVPYLVAGMLLFSVAEMMHSPTSTALAAVAGAGELRSRYMAVYQYGYQIAKIVAPVLFTQLFLVTPTLPWLVLAALIGCAVPAVLKLEDHLPTDALRAAEEHARVSAPRPGGTSEGDERA